MAAPWTWEPNLHDDNYIGAFVATSKPKTRLLLRCRGMKKRLRPGSNRIITRSRAAYTGRKSVQMLVCAFAREAFHCGGTDHFGHSQVAPHSLAGLFSLGATARFPPTEQEIRSQDNLFATTACAAYPPLAPAVSIRSGVSEHFQAAEKFPGQIVELPHGLLPFANKWRSRLNSSKFGRRRSLPYRQGNSVCRNADGRGAGEKVNSS